MSNYSKRGKLARTVRVLTIQSHVVSGYCGNKSATFPLQLLGHEVDVINTVQLSNHTQYKESRGQIFKDKDLEELHMGLKANRLLTQIDHVLSGYMGDISYVVAMANLIKDIKSDRKGLGLECWYTFDPVLGDDNTGYYVPQGKLTTDAYIKYLLPLADIITPNRFEAVELTGMPLDNISGKLEQVTRAAAALHEMGPRVVIITSFENKDRPGYIGCVLSIDRIAFRIKEGTPKRIKKRNAYPTEQSAYYIEVPKLDCPFTGSGDLFTALMVGWLSKNNFQFVDAFTNATNTMYSILRDTFRYSQVTGNNSTLAYELRLIQNKDTILNPPKELKSNQIVLDWHSESS